MKEANIKVEALALNKKTKKGKPYISVKSSDNVWYNVWEKNLFPIFKRGEKFNVLVDEDNGFFSIRDVISDELGVRPSKEEKPSGEDRFNKLMSLLLEIRDEIASLDVPRK